MLKFHEWCSVAFTQLVTVLPNDLHDVFKLKIATGAHWTFLADTDLEVQSALDISEYTDRHPRRQRAAHAAALARAEDREGLRRLLVLGPAVGVPALAGPAGAHDAYQARLRPDDRRREARMGCREGERHGARAPLIFITCTQRRSVPGRGAAFDY